MNAVAEVAGNGKLEVTSRRAPEAVAGIEIGVVTKTPCNFSGGGLKKGQTPVLFLNDSNNRKGIG